MLNSLRFRLPALFLAGIALAGLVTSLIALRLFQDFTRTESLQELRQEARGLADLYAEWAVRAIDEDKAAPTFAASKLEAATGDRLFEVVLVRSFLDSDSGLTRLTRVRGRCRSEHEPDRFLRVRAARRGPAVPRGGLSDPARRRQGRDVLLSDRGQAEGGAAARRGSPCSRGSRSHSSSGSSIVGALALYLSRRITKPVLALSKAMDQVAAGTT